MQDDWVCRDQLLALQAIDHELSRLGEVELCQLCPDGVEPLHCPDVVVLAMANEHFFGNAIDALWIKRQRLDFVGDGFSCLRRRNLRDGGPVRQCPQQ